MAKRVGFLLMTDLPKLGRVAVLQRRGKFSHERMDWANYPGGCQLTVMGKVDDGEDVDQALWREIAEELGSDCIKHLKDYCNNYEDLMTIIDNSDATIYCLYLDEGHFTFLIQDVFRLEPCTGGLEFITKDQVKDIVNLKDYPHGVTNLETIAMFPDEKEALELAFDI